MRKEWLIDYEKKEEELFNKFLEDLKNEKIDENTQYPQKSLLTLNRVIVRTRQIKIGQKQTIETLINEEALLFAKYLRNERKEWIPRTGLN